MCTKIAQKFARAFFYRNPYTWAIKIIVIIVVVIITLMMKAREHHEEKNSILRYAKLINL